MGRFGRFYDTAKWKQLRAKQLRKEQLCKFCLALGHPEIATIVDHIKPHKGDETLFYDPKNLQSLCKQCHDSTKQQIERSGSFSGCDVCGWPLDPNHYYNNGITNMKNTLSYNSLTVGAEEDAAHCHYLEDRPPGGCKTLTACDADYRTLAHESVSEGEKP